MVGGDTLPIDRGSRQRGVGDDSPQSLALALPKIFSLFFKISSVGNNENTDLSKTRLRLQLVYESMLFFVHARSGRYTHTKSLKIFMNNILNSSPLISPDYCPTESSSFPK